MKYICISFHSTWLLWLRFVGSLQPFDVLRQIRFALIDLMDDVFEDLAGIFQALPFYRPVLMTPCIAEILQGHYPPLMLTQDVGEAIYTVMQLKSLRGFSLPRSFTRHLHIIKQRFQQAADSVRGR